MNNKNETRPRVQFSAARFKRLSMPEKLAYLRAAFSALGNGLQVIERRRSASTNFVPAGETARPNRTRELQRTDSFARMLSRAHFEQLSIERKLAYLSGVFRELSLARRRKGDLPRARRAPLPKPALKS